jgi:heme-degrading monooxygenase HmoA
MTTPNPLLAATATSSFRIDSFVVPAAARPELEAAMRRSLALLESLPGFQGHLVLEKAGGPTSINLMTIAAWESPEALEAAAASMRAHYRQIGFDPAASLARWGVGAELGSFRIRGAASR